MTPFAPFAIVDHAAVDRVGVDGGVAREPQLFRDPVAVVEATSPDAVRTAIDRAEAHAHAGRWVVGFVAYEAAPAFDGALAVCAPDPALPLAWFAAFDGFDACTAVPGRLDADWAEEAAVLDRAGWRPDVDGDGHVATVDATRGGIARGDYYQVNHTIRLTADRDVPPLALWRRLRDAQLGARGRGYALYLDAGPWQLACASPELFFARRGHTVSTRPMKGTAPRGRWPAEDEARRSALLASAKERAENVMIVDLLRNDLGRVAAPGSVAVPRLFQAERYPGVWQLTSTVAAELRPHVTLAELFAALFPCGSVTGAPKVAAMRRIAAAEHTPRGPYCGAVGVIAPGGDATFAVGIRTAWRDAARGIVRFGTGGGVTWDSDPRGEWEEAALKARVLRAPPSPRFALLETLRREPAAGLVRLDAHLARVAASARHFGFADPTEAARHALAALSPAEGVERVRVEVARDGTVHVTRAALGPGANAERTAALARTSVCRDDPFLHHKTTRRAVYDLRRAERPEADDVLLWNAEGELTEFTIGNLVVELDGSRYTPPQDCGLLGGVLRAELVASRAVTERVLRPGDLARATGVWLVNALRGWVPVRLLHAASSEGTRGG